jgi:hypothetical protein
MLFNLRFKRRETSPHEGVHPRRRSGEDGPSLRSRKIGIAVGCLFKGRIRRVYFPGQLRKLSLEILKAEVETERAWNIRGSSRSRKILANRSLYNCYDFAFSAEVAFRRAARARMRVESRIGSGESAGLMSNGISVQANATASQPLSPRSRITF